MASTVPWSARGPAYKTVEKQINKAIQGIGKKFDKMYKSGR